MGSGQRSLASVLNPSSVVPLIVFGCLWAGFGIASFFLIGNWGRKYDRKMALIAAHQTPEYTLYVVSIRGDEREHQWVVGLSLRRRERNPQKIDDYEQTQSLGDLKVGRKVAGYKFDGKWFVPRFNKGGFNTGKWVFLGIGVGVPLIVAAIAWVVVRRKRARALLREAMRAASGAEIPLPDAFTKESLHFDSIPSDEELLTLLGTPKYTTLLKFEETPALLRARPGTLPMRYIVPWLVFVAGAITAGPTIARHFGAVVANDAVFYGMVAVMWLIILPVMFIICYMLNRHLAGQKDYFEIDLRSRMLQLPRAGVVIPAGQIESVVVSERWYKSPSEGGWAYVSQIGVLARGGTGGFNYYPVLQDRSKRPFQKPFGDRIAEALNVPVRRIERSLRESRQLADAS